MKARALAAAALALAVPAQAFTGNPGGSAAQFLRVGAGSRALGMGEAFGPVAEGPDAVYWNPGGLAQSRRLELAYSHLELLEHFHHDYAAFSFPAPWIGGTGGFAATSFYQDPLDRVTNANRLVGTFSGHSESFALAYARSFSVGSGYVERDRGYFTDYYHLRGATLPLYHEDEVWEGNVFAGAAAKFISEQLDENSASAVAADGGVLFRHQDLSFLALSFAFRNAGTRPRFIRQHESLPTEFSFGAAFDARFDEGYQRLLGALEIAVPIHGDPYGKLGGEYSFPITAGSAGAVRAGFKTLSAADLNPLSGLTGGIGLRVRQLSVDFGFQPMAELGEAYRASLGYRF